MTLKETILDIDWEVKFPGGEVIEHNNIKRRLPKRVFRLLALIYKVSNASEKSGDKSVAKASKVFFNSIGEEAWKDALTTASTMLEGACDRGDVPKFQHRFFGRSLQTHDFYEKTSTQLVAIAKTLNLQ